jgi:hypothetical protein
MHSSLHIASVGPDPGHEHLNCEIVWMFFRSRLVAQIIGSCPISVLTNPDTGILPYGEPVQYAK